MSESQPQQVPTLTSLPLLPLASHSESSSPIEHPNWYFIHTISSLLTHEECESIIASHQNLVPANATPTTKRDREIFDDADLADKVWSRMERFYVKEVGIEGGRVQDEDGQWWVVKDLNPRWRLARYEAGGRFSPHQDGRRFVSLDSQSFMTVNIYLNTVPASLGGATRALCEPPAGNILSEEIKVLGKVQPEIGMGAVFRDCLWHDGEALREGIKYLLRTDIMYEREVPFEEWDAIGDGARGRKALAMAEGFEDAGNYDEAVKWYKKAFRLAPELERGA
ncbi:hypothetical protein VTL71DRAFT_16583 [Oculimacula yallundae]|uniref:Prolyl 4-hydroxylase alpha subunit domain-containing protein n=1 Tax=Oculimacula yallundae TaxID=86028 RepID=A0ABR4CFG2_9HELO